MTQHLDEMALEALATDREDLVSKDALAHLDECADCAELVYLERIAVEDASLALERIQPDLDVDLMVARAMAAVPEMGAAPSRRSLWMGAGVGAFAAVGLAVLSLPEAESLAGLSAAGNQLLTLVGALDRVVESALPGGWISLAGGALVLSLMLAVPMRFLLGGKPLRAGPAVTSMLAVGLLAVMSVPSSLAHAYRVDGSWGEAEPTVTVNVERQPTSEALRQAAESAGLGIAVVLPEDPQVSLHVTDAPLGEVLEALLGTSDVVVRPGRSLITVRADDGQVLNPPEAEAPADPAPEAEPAAPEDTPEDAIEPSAAAPEPPPAPSPPARRDVATPLAAPSLPPAPAIPPAGVSDRVTFGGDVAIRADEQVRDVVTMGGDAVIAGRAYGDVVTMGGDADLTGEVIGNVLTMGGDIRVAEGARIHGDINAMGGAVDVEEGATVHGRINDAGDGGDDASAPSRHRALGKGTNPLSDVFRWALFNVLIFLFGLFLMGAYRERFTNLRAELSDRPLRSTFGGFFGCTAGCLIAAVLVVTIIGIPGSIVLSTLLVVGGGVGFAAAAWWLGGVLPLRFAKDRPVLQLGIGLGVLFVVGLVPFIGDLVAWGAAFAGLGAVMSTTFGQRTTAQKQARRHVPTGPFSKSARL